MVFVQNMYGLKMKGDHNKITNETLNVAIRKLSDQMKDYKIPKVKSTGYYK